MESQPQNPAFRTNPEEFYPCKWGTFTNSADPNEMPQNATKHQGPHY